MLLELLELLQIFYWKKATYYKAFDQLCTFITNFSQFYFYSKPTKSSGDNWTKTRIYDRRNDTNYM